MPLNASCLDKEQLKLPATIDQIKVMREFVGEFASGCAATEEQLYDIRLAVSEACTNAVRHGSPMGDRCCVNISCQCKQGYLHIEISDEGVFHEKVSSTHDEMSMNGRGILLMLSAMDKVTFDESNVGTVVTLAKKLERK